jgi:hypothetical protein
MNELKNKAKKIINSIDACTYKPNEPVAWCVYDYVKEEDENGEIFGYYHNDNDEWYESGSINDIVNQIIKEDNSDCDELTGLVKTECKQYSYVYKKAEDYAQVFLTKEAAESFLLENKNHYHEKAKIDCTIFWRNDEMKDIIAILREFVNN